ncbi:DUF4363 family protein [Clostridium uliginosum]|uniref:DUF4363 domain-containing protein n=1 Tax=Clostridium uliginosum TaxID=119641 RepID=A0A1I1PZA0_9CLOT|nr:DUF4363 family protein [Clostridium uliginosum]SFD15075.1 protein of unknown function [Clostridium uliginosum]
MKNAMISIFLFLSIMILIYFANNSLLKLCGRITTLSEDIEITLTQDNFEEAYTQSIQLMNLIQSEGFITSIYVNHQDFDILVNDAVKLSVYLTYKDAEDADATLHSLKYNAQNIKKLQIPTLENIL